MQPTDDTPRLTLASNLDFLDLYNQDGLARLDAKFLEHVLNAAPTLYHQLNIIRSAPPPHDKDAAQLIIALAPLLEEFLANLFGIEAEVNSLRIQHTALAPLFACKRLFVQRQAAKSYSEEQLDQMQPEITAAEALLRGAGIEPTDELSFATRIMEWVEQQQLHLLEAAKLYAAWALYSETGKRRHKAGRLFKMPHKLDFEHLLNAKRQNNITCADEESLSPRQGFAHSDPGVSLTYALDHTHYCIFCHNQGKDSCSRGIKDKTTGSYSRNNLQVTLTGCPLEEKISEMNTLKSEGWIIGALATVIIDNPMVAATGHRICNDCMKACIYQKQEPVDIPAVESRVLSDVLSLPWGFEIYSLLTRWNPLNFHHPLPLPIQPHKILVVGLGPAGFTLAHYLLQQGYTVVAVEGTKIEPLAPEFSGITLQGAHVPFTPIRDINVLYEDLATRKAYGFGGVAEYGITVRWQKNYLTIIRLLLERRAKFRMYGGVRFGSNLTYQRALDIGFDHIALATGAGQPNLPSIPNIMARGVRTASDFLMALQLTGAARPDSIANLQIKLPVVVIGGGLTAVDAATESMAYYPVQVEKYLQRYEQLGESIFAGLDAKAMQTAQEFIAHGKALRNATTPSQRLQLLQSWGGVKIAYRKRIQDAPSYRLNHEELQKALGEGIEFIDQLDPQVIETDSDGDCIGIRFNMEDGKLYTLPAHTVLIATGTKPNTILAQEQSMPIVVQNGYFVARDNDGTTQQPERNAKPTVPYVMTTIADDGRKSSFFGDLHPSYAGNVVKAMASAKQGYPLICATLNQQQSMNTLTAAEFFKILDSNLIAVVHKIEQLAPRIVEVVARAPFAASEFRPGQFFRLQNYEANALRQHNITLAMEGIALTGATVLPNEGLISMVVLMMGGSSDLCAHLKPNEPIVLMGPTGTPTHIPMNETVLLIGGGLGNAVLFSIGRAMRANGCKVLYFAGYRQLIDRYKLDEIEEAADVVVWCCDETLPEARRVDDLAFYGNLVEAIIAYHVGSLGAKPIPLESVQRILTIGSDGMMAAIVEACHSKFASIFRPGIKIIASINSPMQCMMKEICGQCLQRHVDPVTGTESYVYSCYNQDQDANFVDFYNLHMRLTQNCIQENATTALLTQVLPQQNSS